LRPARRPSDAMQQPPVSDPNREPRRGTRPVDRDRRGPRRTRERRLLEPAPPKEGAGPGAGPAPNPRAGRHGGEASRASGADPYRARTVSGPAGPGNAGLLAAHRGALPRD